MKKVIGVIFILAGLFTASAQTVPYNVNKKKYPLGDEFEKLLPLKLGKWTRFAYHDFVPNQETGTVYYRLDDYQVYLTFGKAYSQAGMEVIWTRIFNDATAGKENQIKQKNAISPSSKYLLMQGKYSYYYVWTRNLYFFSIKTKNKIIADEFMKVFPY
jgi:hypothetical protein